MRECVGERECECVGESACGRVSTRRVSVWDRVSVWGRE